MPWKRNVFAEFMRIQVQNDAAASSGDETAASEAATARHWFNERAVNEVESEYVASIFQDYGASMDDAQSYYVDIRTRIIDLYHRDPGRYLTSTECAKLIDCDPASLVKVYCILNHWGLINYGALRSFTPEDARLSQFKREIDVLRPDIAENTGNDGGGDGGGDDSHGGPSSEATSAHATSGHEDEPVDELEALNAPFRVSPDGEATAPPKRSPRVRHCQTCMEPCKYMYYMISELSITEPLEKFRDAVWCAKCFSNSRYPLEVPKRALRNSIVPLGATGSCDSLMVSKWTPERRERLYAAIDKFGLNWRMVKQEMGDEVTVRECMYHFLVAPLERETRGVVRLPVCFSGVYDRQAPPPFFSSQNTVTAFLAFCASNLSPVVASRAAKALLDHVMQADEPTAPSAMCSDSEASAAEGDSSCSSSSIFMDVLPTLAPRGPLKRKDSLHQNAFNAEKREESIESAARLQSKATVDEFLTTEEGGGAQTQTQISPLISDAVLFRGFKAAMQASVDTCRELAALEQSKIDELLAQLIDLKIKRIRDKIRTHAVAEEQMDNYRVQMRLELSRILQCHTTS